MNEPLIDEWILEQGDDVEAAEVAYCGGYIEPGERLVALITGIVEGEPGLDRMALTDRRVFFYPRKTQRGAISFNYQQLSGFQGKEGLVLTHLGEINLSTPGRNVRFNKVGVEYIDQILGIISTMRE